MTDRSVPGSRPDVGSSRNSSDGFVSSSSATLVRLRWPPDRSLIGFSASAVSFSFFSTPSMPLSLFLECRVRGEAQAGGVSQGLADSETGVQHVVLRYQRDAVAELVVVVIEAPSRVADLARIRRVRPHERPEESRFSGPAGADHAEHGPARQREADVVQQDLAAGGLTVRFEASNVLFPEST